MWQMDDPAAYLIAYSEDLAVEQFGYLDRIFTGIGESPLMWGYFPHTGAPYRAYLFRLGRRTHYWIVYLVDEESDTVNIVAFWNASRDPKKFDV